LSSNVPQKGRSVSFPRAIRNCAGVSCACHSASDLMTCGLSTGPTSTPRLLMTLTCIAVLLGLGNGNSHRHTRPGATAAAIAKVADGHSEDVALGLRHTVRKACPTQENRSGSGAGRILRRRRAARDRLLTIGNKAPARCQSRVTDAVMVAEVP